MKLFSCWIVLSSALLPCVSFAGFSIPSIRSIECSDLHPTSALNVYLTTNGPAAETSGGPGSNYWIGMNYGNDANPYGDSQSGVLELANDPDQDGGVISLNGGDCMGGASGVHTTRLVLRPTGRAGLYFGVLSGCIEGSGGWGPLNNHPMKCVIR